MHKRISLIFALLTAFLIIATAQSKRFQSEIYTTIDSIGDVPYGEASSSLLGVDKKPVVKWFKEDKLHSNDEGYKMWAEPIKKALPK